MPDRDAGEGILEGPDGTPYQSPLWAEAFLGLVRAGHRLARELDAERKEGHGMALHAFEVLLFLTVVAEEGRLGMTELAKQLARITSSGPRSAAATSRSRWRGRGSSPSPRG